MPNTNKPNPYEVYSLGEAADAEFFKNKHGKPTKNRNTVRRIINLNPDYFGYGKHSGTGKIWHLKGSDIIRFQKDKYEIRR